MRTLRDYQRVAIQTAVREVLYRNGFGLILGMGLGKTIVSLMTIDILKLCIGIDRILITAPSKVQNHWLAESGAWGTRTPVYVLDGEPEARLETLHSGKPGIYVISHGLLKWIEPLRIPFDLFVVDEGSKFRNWSAKRTKAATYLADRIPYRLTLTGTPAPNHSGEVFAQHYLLDRGLTFGKTIGEFREKFMYRGGYENREWIFNDAYQPYLASLLSPWYLRQNTIDHLDMPKLIEREILIDLPPDILRVYKEFEKQMFTQLATGEEVIALSGAGKYNLCRQIASGGAYVEGVPVGVHDAKIEALQDIIDETGRPVLVAYNYTHEMQRICQAFPHAAVIRGGVSNKQTQDIIQRWQRGEIRLLVCQSESISHGVDGLQRGGCDLVWFTLTDHPETWDQLISRLWRQGQTNPVTVHYLLANKTVELAVKKLIHTKDKKQQSLLKALEDYRIWNHGNNAPGHCPPPQLVSTNVAWDAYPSFGTVPSYGFMA